jgi:hypothetical protein
MELRHTEGKPGTTNKMMLKSTFAHRVENGQKSLSGSKNKAACEQPQTKYFYSWQAKNSSE